MFCCLSNSPSEDEIIESWGHYKTPTISVACVTYNHEDFIEQAIMGFLQQKTTYPFEIVIHDDASTDGTVGILKRYADQYPNIIRLILQKENKYSKGNNPLQFIYPKLRGRYVAACEGDDYWVDPLKLEKQAFFLENNPKYVICGHDARVVDQHGNILQESKLQSSHQKDYSGWELQTGSGFVLTLSWFFRRVLSENELDSEYRLVTNADNFLLSLLGHHGASHYHNDIEPAVYRKHSAGIWGMAAEKAKRRAQATSWFLIGNYYRRNGNKDLAEIWFKKAVRTVLPIISLKDIARELLIRFSCARFFRRLGIFKF